MTAVPPEQAPVLEAEGSTPHDADYADLFAFTASSKPSDIPWSSYPRFVELARSSNESHALHGVLLLRKLLSIDGEIVAKRITDVLETGIAETLVRYLDVTPSVDRKLRFEACWVLCNIASGTADHSKALFKLGAAEAMVAAMRDAAPEDDDLRDTAAWALGNLAGDGAVARDRVLSAGAVEVVCAHVRNALGRASTANANAVWCLSNLCRFKPSPSFASIAEMLPVACALVSSSHKESRDNAGWIISYIADGGSDGIDAVIASGVLEVLVSVSMTEPGDSSVQTQCARIFGNIATGSTQQTQAIIDAGAVPAMLRLAASRKRGLRKEAAWGLSNIAAGTRSQVDACLTLGVVSGIAALCLENDESDTSVSRERAFVLSNAFSSASYAQTKRMVDEERCLDALCVLVDSSDARVVSVALQGIEGALEGAAPDPAETDGSASDADADPHGAPKQQRRAPPPPTLLARISQLVMDSGGLHRIVDVSENGGAGSATADSCLQKLALEGVFSGVAACPFEVCV